jgi:hypothetical protein
MTWRRGTARLSADRAYRYMLTRWWADGLVMMFIGLNPSTADADTDDPTVRRLIGFARRESCGSVWVVNLFALRATDPRALRVSPDPVGPLNDRFLRERTRAACVAAAWGAHGNLNGRSAQVRAMFPAVPLLLLCFGLTANGEPRHPLYMRSDAPLLSLPGSSVQTPARSRTGQSPLRAGASSPQCLGGPVEHF